MTFTSHVQPVTCHSAIHPEPNTHRWRTQCPPDILDSLAPHHITRISHSAIMLSSSAIAHRPILSHDCVSLRRIVALLCGCRTNTPVDVPRSPSDREALIFCLDVCVNVRACAHTKQKARLGSTNRRARSLFTRAVVCTASQTHRPGTVFVAAGIRDCQHLSLGS